MKNLILLTAIAISAGVYAQDDSTNQKMSMHDMNNNQHQNMQNNPVYKSHPDGLMMQKGKLIKVKNGQMTVFQKNDTILSNGTKVMSDGTCIKKDGSKMMLKEGQHVDMSGNLISMKTNKDMYLVPDSTRKK